MRTANEYEYYEGVRGVGKHVAPPAGAVHAFFHPERSESKTSCLSSRRAVDLVIGSI